MPAHEEEKPDIRFLEAWKEWTSQKPARSPHEAAAQVHSRLAQREAQRQPGWLYAAAGATLLFLSVGTAYLWVTGGPAAPAALPAIQQPAPLGEGVVLIWLDEKTPLYMNYQTPGGSRAH
jgi:hypothetical protein